MENKKTPEALTLWENVIYLSQTMKEAKAIMEAKEKKTQETTRDASIMARELYLSKLSYAHNFTNFEKQICVFLLNGDSGEKAIESKFKVLQQLLLTRRHILDILGDLEEEKKEAKGDLK